MLLHTFRPKYKLPDFKYRPSTQLRDVMPEPGIKEEGGYGWLIALLIVTILVASVIFTALAL